MTVPVPEKLENLLTELGLSVGRVGDNEVWCLCPAHARRTGSPDSKANNFSVNRNTGDAFCFSCRFSTNLVGLVREVLGYDMWDALTWLREHGASLTDYVRRVNDVIEAREKGVSRTAQTHAQMLDEADPDLEFVLLEPVPEEKLASRYLSRTSVDAYKVRWLDGSWVLPFIDDTGRVRGWQLKHPNYVLNYPKGRVKKSRYLFGAHLHNPGQRAYIVESPLDAVRLHTAGYDGGLATFGATVSFAQVKLLAELTDDVVLVMDNDEAGWNATRWLRDELLTRTRRLHIATYADLELAKDPGDLSEEGIDHLLENCQSALLAKLPATA
jgi:DNA primase